MNLTIDHEQLFNSLSIGIILFDEAFKVTYANQTGIEWLGLKTDPNTKALSTDPFWTIVDKHGEPLETHQFPAVIVSTTQKPLNNYEIGVLNQTTQEYTWFLTNTFIEKSTDSDSIQYVVQFTNISDQKELISFKDIVSNTNDSVIVTQAIDVKRGGAKIVYVNPAFSKLTGYTSEEVLGKTPDFLSGEKTSPVTAKRIMDNLANGKPVREEVINYRKDGTPYWVDLNIVPLLNSKNIVTHFASIERNITAIKDKTLSLEKLAKTDTLTELMNRRGLMIDGVNVIENCYKSDKPFILAMMDIDFFKAVNDSFGHDAGDIVLKSLAELLTDNLRNRDIIARFGGEEFVLILAGEPAPILIKKIEHIRQLIEERAFDIDNETQFQLTCSFGVVASGVHDLDIETLIKKADKAMYQSKQNGRNQVTLFED